MVVANVLSSTDMLTGKPLTAPSREMISTRKTVEHLALISGAATSSSAAAAAEVTPGPRERPLAIAEQATMAIAQKATEEPRVRPGERIPVATLGRTAAIVHPHEELRNQKKVWKNRLSSQE